MRVVIGLDAEGKSRLQDNREDAETKEAVGQEARVGGGRGKCVVCFCSNGGKRDSLGMLQCKPGDRLVFNEELLPKNVNMIRPD